MISTLKDLRIVESGRLILHEAYDRDRLSRLRERIEAEGVQRNPVIVAPHGEDHLVLDGAHRVHALTALGCRLVLVQLVENPRTADSWGHLLDGRGLEAEVRSIRGIEVFAEEPDGGWLAEMELPGGRRMFVRARARGLPEEVRALWGIRALYPEGAVVRRLDADETVEPAGDEAVIRYRPFTPGELVEVVRSGAVLPAGTTRFRVRERVLGVRFPLPKMKEGDVAARNAELGKLVRELWDQNRIRYYGEPVVLFE